MPPVGYVRNSVYLKYEIVYKFWGVKMLNLVDDVLPVSEFRANATSLISQARKTHRPIVLTQHGKTSAVVVGIEEYQEMLETLEYLRKNNEAEQEIAAGKGISHSEAKKAIIARTKR